MMIKGRGRGRGIVSMLKKPGPEPKKEKSIHEYIQELHIGEIQSTFDFVRRPSARSQDILDETVSEVCSRALKETDFADVAASLLQKLWVLDQPNNLSIRKPLLSRVQKLYQGRNELTDEEFQGYSALLCELFSTLKILDEPLKALVGPVFNVMKGLLDRAKKSLDSMLTFHVLLLKHGSHLERENKVMAISPHLFILLLEPPSYLQFW